MKIAIIGTGYVGLVTGTCFAEMGIDVTCVDLLESKIEGLKQGIIPIYEPGLDDLVKRNCKAGRLHFATDITSYLNQLDVFFIAVVTPPDEDGSAELKYVLGVAKTIGENINQYILPTDFIWITKRSKPLSCVPEMIKGSYPTDNGNYIFTKEEMLEFLKKRTIV